MTTQLKATTWKEYEEFRASVKLTGKKEKVMFGGVDVREERTYKSDRYVRQKYLEFVKAGDHQLTLNFLLGLSVDELYACMPQEIKWYRTKVECFGYLHWLLALDIPSLHWIWPRSFDVIRNMWIDDNGPLGIHQLERMGEL